MLKVLGLGLDYEAFDKAQTRGDFTDRLKEMANHLQKLTRVIYAPVAWPLKRVDITDNVDVYFTHSKNKRAFKKDARAVLGEILKKEAYDLITAEDYLMAGLTGLHLRKVYGIPLNVQINDGRINNPYWIQERPKNYILNMIAKYVVRRADTIRTVSERTKRDLIDLGVSPERIYVAPTVVDTSRFENADGSTLRQKYLGNKYERIILFVGRLSREKDILTILKALQKTVKEYPKTLLLLVGQGPEEAYLTAMVEEFDLKDNVHFNGAVDYGSIPQYFACADMMVLASLHEGRANVLVEGGLSSKPILASNVGDADQYIKDGETGFIFEPGDYEDLANKIMIFLKDPQKIKDFGERSYLHVQEKLNKYNKRELLIDCWEETKRSLKA